MPDSFGDTDITALVNRRMSRESAPLATPSLPTSEESRKEEDEKPAKVGRRPTKVNINVNDQKWHWLRMLSAANRIPLAVLHEEWISSLQESEDAANRLVRNSRARLEAERKAEKRRRSGS